ncbi:MAG: hypothetical protein JWR26_962 [Pedosphaera sp.]|nr:hypothetical protein [Pedosphaera sp.]
MNPKCSLRNSAGFTLIELVISSALMALILVSAYLCFNAGIASQRLIEPRAEIFQSARVAMAIMSADLRCACPLSKEFEFLGMHRMIKDVEADNLDFATHHYNPAKASEGDFCQVSLFLEEDPKSGKFNLWRRRNPMIALDPLSGGSREEIAKGLRGLKFEYYDGFDWYEKWGEVKGSGKEQTSSSDALNLSGMPEAVRITLSFDPNPRGKKSAITDGEPAEKPLVFQTVARLNLAAISQSRSSNGSSTNSLSSGAGSSTATREQRGVNQ